MLLFGALVLLLALAPVRLAAAAPRHDASENYQSEGDPGKDEGSEIRDRERWFLAQRSYPAKATPAEALPRAQEQAQRNGTFSLSGVGGGGAQAGALTPLAGWTSLGPQPLTGDGTTLTKYTGASPLAGRVTTIATDPRNSNVAYVGAAGGGVWKTTTGGTSWTPLTDSLISGANALGPIAIGALAIDPLNPDTIYAGTGEANSALDSYYGSGVFRSTDGGAHWSKLSAPVAGCGIEDMAVKPDDSGTILVAASAGIGTGGTNGCQEGIYRSADGGTTWTHPAFSRMNDIDFDRTSPSVVYAARYGDGIYRSTNGGANWAKLATQPTTSGLGRMRIAVAPSNGQRLYALSAEFGSGRLLGIWTSADAGASWTQLPSDPDFCGSPNGSCWYNLDLAVDPANAGTFYAGGIWFYKYVNFGAQFTRLADDSSGIHSDQHALAFDSASRLWVGNDGGIYRTANAGGSFSNLNAGLSITQHVAGIDGSLAGTFVAGTQDNGLARYNGSLAWARSGGFGDAGYSAADPTNGNVIYSTYPNVGGGVNVFKTVDGVNYAAADGIDRQDPSQFYFPLVMHPHNRLILYAGTDRLWATADGAASWGAKSPHFPGTITAIGPAPSSTATVYAGAMGTHLEVTTNSGTNWTDRGAGLPSAFISDIAVDDASPGVAYVALSGFHHGHVFKTTNFGANWTDVSGDLPDTPVSAITLDQRAGSTVMYVGTDVGVFASDTGANWLRASGMPDVVVTDLRIDTATSSLVAATHGRGVFAAHLPNPTGPPNDDFASAQALNGATATRTGDTNTGATKETGEPSHAGNAGGKSVWYRWTPSANGSVTVDTAGSNFDSLLGVYTGSAVNGLTEVASNDDENNGAGILTSKVQFTAVAGTTYRIAVDGFDGAPGTVNVHLAQTVPQFALTVNKSGTGTGSVTSSPAGIDCGTSCSAPYDAGTDVTLTATASGGSAFTGWSGACTGAGNTCVVTMSAAKSATATFGPPPPAPPNNAFAGAQALSGTTASRTGDGNGGATKETGEPAHAGNVGGASVWYQWTPTTNGSAVVDTAGSDFDTLLAVYTGTAVTGLTEVASNDDENNGGGILTSKVQFHANAGTTYRIAVDGYNTGAGPGTGSIDVHLAQTSDRFALSVTKAGNGAGTVSSAPAGIDCGANCSGTFDDGTALSLTANAAPGSTFDGWTGSCSGGAQMCNLTMSADRSATATFTSLDHTPPDTTIDSAPPALTNSRSVTFAFSASEPGSTFECRFDGGGGFGPCTSPLTYGPVTDGSHGLEVRAVDAAQNADPTPAARAFTVDATPPETTLGSGPSGTIGESAATFTFSSSEPGSTFTCRLDAIPWVACPSPMGYSGLPDGQRLFEVSATDAAGNTDPTPATRQFTVATGGSDPIAVIGFGPKPGLGQALRRGVPLVYSCRLACSITAGIEPSAAAAQRFGFAAGGRIARGSSTLGAAGAKKFKVRFKGSARRKLRRARSLRGTVIATATSPGILGAERHMGAIRLRR